MNRLWGRSLVHIFALSEMALLLREYVVVCYLSFAEEQIVKALSYAAFLLNYSVLSSKYKGSIFGQLLWMDFFFFCPLKDVLISLRNLSGLSSVTHAYGIPVGNWKRGEGKVRTEFPCY